MKRSRAGGSGSKEDADEDDRSSSSSATTKRTKQIREESPDSARVTELLKMCLQKVCEMQQDLAREAEQEEDAEAAGYAACAIETLRFLASEGLPPTHPMVRSLSGRLLGQDDPR